MGEDIVGGRRKDAPIRGNRFSSKDIVVLNFGVHHMCGSQRSLATRLAAILDKLAAQPSRPDGVPLLIYRETSAMHFLHQADGSYDPKHDNLESPSRGFCEPGHTKPTCWVAVEKRELSASCHTSSPST